LQAYPYPGNVRELENILERALIIGSGMGFLSPEHLGLGLPGGRLPPEPASAVGLAGDGVVCKDDDQAIPLPQDFLLENWERYAIMKALACCEGNRTKAAGLLGMGRRTLQEKLRLYALDTEPGTVKSS
jgi:two-component system, NtrC family, response regulator AtoC